MTIQNQVFTNYSNWHKAYYEGTDFYAVLIEETLVPLASSKDNEVFIYGQGWVKIGRKKMVKIPALRDNTDINFYLNEYGANCLFYALTNKALDSAQRDCSWKDEWLEFTAMIDIGVSRWKTIIEDFHRLSNRVKEIYRDKYGIVSVEHLGASYSKAFTPKIRHYFKYPFRCKPHLNPLEDDTGLFCTYVHCFLASNFNRYIDELDSCPLPISVKDKLVYLFDDEVADMYEKLMFSLDNQACLE